MGLVLTMVRREILFSLRRPLFWVFLILSVLFTIGYFIGGVQVNVNSGGLAADEKVHINGPYQLALFYMAIPFVVYTLFAALALATTVLRDGELQVEEVLRGTHLSARQYLLGKFLGTGAWVFGLLLLGLIVAIVTDIVTSGIAAKGGMDDPRIYGVFDLRYHLYPFLAFTLPWMFFAMTISFFLGERTRSPLIIFGSLGLLYVAVLSFGDFSPKSVERWSQDTLNTEWSVVQGWVDPSGLSWLTETYAKEDLGVSFYNSVIPSIDRPFAINRGALVLLGLLGFLWSLQRYGRSRNGKLAAASEPPKQTTASPELDLALPPTLMTARKRGGAAGILRIFRTELALLSRQPSLWIFTPLIWIFSIPAAFFIPGPWDAKVILTANRASYLLVTVLAPWVCAYGACLMIEVMNRERATRFGDIYSCSPVKTFSTVVGKILAVITAMVGIVAGAALITAVLQVAIHETNPEPLVYLRNLGILLVPGLAFFIVLGAFFSSLTRGRLASFGLLIGFGLVYIVGLFTGWLDWRGKVIPTSLVIPSDISGLRPYEVQLWDNRALVLAVTIALIVLTVYLHPRTDRPRLLLFSWRELRQRKIGTFVFIALIVTSLVSAVRLDLAMDNGPDAKWREDYADEYALRNRVKWGNPGQQVPEYKTLDFRVDFYPSERRYAVDGLFTFINRSQETFRVLPLTMGLDFDIEPTGHIYFVKDNEEVEATVDDRNQLYEVTLLKPLGPGEETTLHLTYEGTVHNGAGKRSGAFSEWIVEDAIFVDSFGSSFLPAVGYIDPQSPNQDTSDEAMSPEELTAHYDGVHSALLGGYGTFDVKVRISVPEDLTALSSGTLIKQIQEENRTVYHYETDHPVYFFPIMAGRYEKHTKGDCTVYYHKAHQQNIETIAQTLDQSLRFYSAVFSPYPFTELRIVEFPQFAGFAMGHPSLIPFSEAMGFLTQGDDGISNINFMVTAHEVAHQWWGTITTPAAVPGAPFLTEALAHYSTLLMEERFNGRVAARNRRIEFEKLYVESRNPDVERPIVRIDGSEQSDQPLWYNKGGLVFWMTAETIGRERFIESLRAYIEEFAFQTDHPTIHDVLRHIRAKADPEHEEFLRQWFYEVVLPRPEVLSTEVSPTTEGFETKIVVKNSGTGTIDLDVEVANRRRLSTEIGMEEKPTPLSFDTLADAYGWDEEENRPKETDEDEQVALASNRSPSDMATEEKEAEPYLSTRITVRISAGEEKEVVVRSAFEPGHLLLDPDAKILMSGRTTAKKQLDQGAGGP